MKRALRSVGLVIGLTACMAAPGAAQLLAFVTVGPTIPTGDFGETANTGWLLTGGFGFPVTEEGNAAFVLEGLIGGNDHGDSGDSRLYGAMGHLEFIFGEEGERATPFVFGGAGLLGDRTDLILVDDDETDWQIALNGGAGIGFDVGRANLILLSRYIHGIDDLAFFNIQAGLSFAVGGDGM